MYIRLVPQGPIESVEVITASNGDSTSYVPVSGESIDVHFRICRKNFPKEIVSFVEDHFEEFAPVVLDHMEKMSSLLVIKQSMR